jgi:acyl carrier protein
VKVRGYRIELGEIEYALLQHPAVRGAVVGLYREGGEEGRLVAWMTAEEGAEPGAEELRDHLRGRLPGYMVPVAFVLLEDFPQTRSGKLDRRALPPPDRAADAGVREYVAPRNESEEALAGIIAELLHIERVGIYDSFFDLGGHSLLAIQLVSRIRELFEVEVPLRTIFESPMVALLAVAVEELILADLEAMLGEEDGAEELLGMDME